MALAPATAADDLPTVPRPNFSNCQAILQHRDDDDNNVVEDERSFSHVAVCVCVCVPVLAAGFS